MSDGVSKWLSSLSSEYYSPDQPVEALPRTIAQSSQKRRRNEPTPPLSYCDMDDETPTKRQRRGFSQNVDETPRAKRTLSSHASSISSRSYASTNSPRSSPRKRLATLDLLEDGIETRALSMSATDIPAELANFVGKFIPCRNGVGVVPASRRPEFEAELSPALLSEHNFACPSPETNTESFPSFQSISEIAAWAQRCQEERAEEAAWNSAVHFKVLCLALFNSPRPVSRKVSFKQWYGMAKNPSNLPFANYISTTAEIIKQYQPSAAVGKKVDFVLCLEPTVLGITKSVRNIRKIAPAESINHTEFEPLRNRPIIASIETKRENASTDDAELQLSTWQASQWNMLETLLRELHGDALAADKLKGLPFLPGIIIAGHDWHLVATTRENSRTVSSLPFWL